MLLNIIINQWQYLYNYLLIKHILLQLQNIKQDIIIF